MGACYHASSNHHCKLLQPHFMLIGACARVHLSADSRQLGLPPAVPCTALALWPPVGQWSQCQQALVGGSSTSSRYQEVWLVAPRFRVDLEPVISETMRAALSERRPLCGTYARNGYPEYTHHIWSISVRLSWCADDSRPSVWIASNLEQSSFSSVLVARLMTDPRVLRSYPRLKSRVRIGRRVWARWGACAAM